MKAHVAFTMGHTRRVHFHDKYFFIPVNRLSFSTFRQKIRNCTGRPLSRRQPGGIARLLNLQHFVTMNAPGADGRNASFTLAHFYHTFSLFIRHILFACVDAKPIFRVSRLHWHILRVEKLACQLFGTYVATRKMRQKVSIGIGKFSAQ